MLTYRYTKNQELVSPHVGSTIMIEKIHEWTGNDRQNIKNIALLRVDAAVKERNQEWTEEWEFEWPDENIAAMDKAMHLIAAHVEQRGQLMYRDGLKREAYIDVQPWLRIGWVDIGGGFHAYARFKKENHTYTVQFENAPELYKLRHKLQFALQE